MQREEFPLEENSAIIVVLHWWDRTTDPPFQPSLRDSISSATEPKVKNLGLWSSVPFGTRRTRSKTGVDWGVIETIYEAMLRSHLHLLLCGLIVLWPLPGVCGASVLQQDRHWVLPGPFYAARVLSQRDNCR